VPPTPRTPRFFNGRDLAGWRLFLADNKSEPAPRRLPTASFISRRKLSAISSAEKHFSNYHLHVEWRWPKDGPPPTPTAA